MATLAPKGSSWHLILQQMAEKWKAVSGGRVTLTLYPGGVAGDDQDVVRKMQLGTLNAALLTGSGLADIDRNVLALQIPMLYDSYEELDWVREKISPNLEKIYEQKGFVVLNWSDAGWVHFFAKSAVRTPDDLKALKLFTGAGDVQTVELWKASGFRPVPLPTTEISTALQTGLVTALPSPPQAAVILQWYNDAKFMTDLNWAVLIGGTLISKKAWDKIPAELQGPLLEAARETGKRLRDEIRQRGPSDIEAMEKRGLTVVHLDAATIELWRRIAENAYPQLRGSFVPAEAFDEAKRLRDEFRNQSKPAR
ncbi:MAG TPA: TRAP transporter substrate-binding protein DctP [Acidobacteriota bacterium]|nr:TRAP transporter substrate-binding protein DctP [Acidobacteriota bacterium]